MINSIISYISQNGPTLIKEVIFLILSIVLPLCFIPKDSNPNRTNYTSIKQIVFYINQTINVPYQGKTVAYPNHTSYDEYQDNKNKPKQNQTTSDNSLVWLFIIVGLSFYIKNHAIILKYFTVFTLGLLACIITVIYRLSRNNNFDNLNKLWIVFLGIIVISDFSLIFFMSKQNIGGNILNSVYYFSGFFCMILPNLIAIIIIVHMFALNVFLVRPGKISGLIIRKTKLLDNSLFSIGTILTISCLISLLCSSGLVFDWISHSNNKNFDLFIKSFSK